MPGQLVFGADAVTPATSLADGQVSRRSAGNLIGTDGLHFSGGFTILQTEGRTSAAAGSLISLGTLVSSAAIGITCPTDTNNGQNPFSLSQGSQARFVLTGSNGATNARITIGTAANPAGITDLVLRGNLTMVRADNAVALIGSFGSAGGLTLGGAGDTISFYSVSPVPRQTLSTGAGKTADDIITFLQLIGLVHQ